MLPTGTITKTRLLLDRARGITDVPNVVQALVGFALHISWNPGDYEGAMKEAAYDLELENIDEFKRALEIFFDILPQLKQGDSSTGRPRL
jgi:hypothetical protein